MHKLPCSIQHGSDKGERTTSSGGVQAGWKISASVIQEGDRKHREGRTIGRVREGKHNLMTVSKVRGENTNFVTSVNEGFSPPIDALDDLENFRGKKLVAQTTEGNYN